MLNKRKIQIALELYSNKHINLEEFIALLDLHVSEPNANNLPNNVSIS